MCGVSKFGEFILESEVLVLINWQNIVKGFEGKRRDGDEGDYADALAGQVFLCLSVVFVKFLFDLYFQVVQISFGYKFTVVNIHANKKNQVRRLAMEVRQLASAGQITVLNGGSGGILSILLFSFMLYCS